MNTSEAKNNLGIWISKQMEHAIDVVVIYDCTMKGARPELVGSFCRISVMVYGDCKYEFVTGVRKGNGPRIWTVQGALRHVRRGLGWYGPVSLRSAAERDETSSS